MKLLIHNKVRDVVTMSRFARMLGVTTDYIIKMEQRGIMPRANYRAPDIQTQTGKTVVGARVYTLELATAVSFVWKNKRMAQNNKISEETKQKIRDLFGEEREGKI